MRKRVRFGAGRISAIALSTVASLLASTVDPSVVAAHASPARAAKAARAVAAAPPGMPEVTWDRWPEWSIWDSLLNTDDANPHTSWNDWTPSSPAGEQARADSCRVGHALHVGGPEVRALAQGALAGCDADRRRVLVANSAGNTRLAPGAFAKDWLAARRRALGASERVRGELERALDQVFYALDDYVIDPGLRDSGDMSDEELTSRVRAALAAIR